MAARERLRIVDVRRPVQGRHQIAAFLQTEAGQDVRATLGDRPEADADIGHHVPDQAGPSPRPSASRLSIAVSVEQSSRLGEAVDDDPVHLLRHRALERAHPGLHVGERNLTLGRNERRAEGRVGVAVDQHRVGALRDQDRLQADHRGRRLPGMAAGADPELVVGRRQLELLEEELGELAVVVLTGVHEDLRGRASRR